MANKGDRSLQQVRFPVVLHSTLMIMVLTLVLGSSAWAGGREKVLHNFKGGKDGFQPIFSTLVADAAGNLYGATLQGGGHGCFYGCGTVFELTPSNTGHWTEKVLHSFKGGKDGRGPESGLIFDKSGNLYGTTVNGGTGRNCSVRQSGCGTVFELSPNGNGTWTESVLYNFQGSPDGSYPSGNLVFDGAGNLYGTTQGSGSGTGSCGISGCGTVFALTPKSGGGWTETVLYNFNGDKDGAAPWAGVVFDAAGNLYGTTYYGGGSPYCVLSCGTVFELKRVGGQWKESVLYGFQGGGNGDIPLGGVILDAAGNLYGTLAGGGNDGGAVFELRHVGGQWKEHMIYNFCSRDNCADGAGPESGLAIDKAGNLYGATLSGGMGRCPGTMCGTLFKLAHTQSGWQETVLHNFGNGGDGFWPDSVVIFDAKGSIYGTTESGGTATSGTVYEVTP
jgi:uncharacterized repeat protein (TIGR03803 family)